MKNVSALVGALVLATVAEAGVLTNLTVHSAKMDLDIPVSILLPEGYAPSGTNRYPSVYVLHGAGGTGRRRAEDPAAMQMIDLYGMIGIFPDDNRTSWWLDSPIDPKSQYETFVINELLPFVDRNFRTIPSRTQRGILGGSMGGHGACYLGMRHTDLFGVIGNIYGGVDLLPWAWVGRWDIDKRLGDYETHADRWIEHSVMNVAKSLKNGEVELITAIGTEDFFLGCNRQLHEMLSANGIAHTYIEMRAPTAVESLHSKFYRRAAALCYRFVHNYFKDGYGHLGDIDVRE